MQDIRLTPTSFIVLGLLEQVGEATPYDLKRLVGFSIGYFWSLQHAQLYSEPERLAAAGYLTVEHEEGGRRRKRYSLTERGRRAFEEWRGEPPEDLGELREPALLKLFFGADPTVLAETQLAAHRRRLSDYETLSETIPEKATKANRLTLDAGIGHEYEWIRFWERILRRGDAHPSRAHPAEPDASGHPSRAHPAEPGASGHPSRAHPAEPDASG